MKPTKIWFESVVCDLHLADMRSVQVEQGKGPDIRLLDGFGKCPVGSCTRFLGNEGYCDLTKDHEFARIRKEPTCSRTHQPQPMYIQRTPECLLWVCPVCYCADPYWGFVKP